MVTGDAEGRVERPGARAEGSGRYPREQAVGVSNTTARREHCLEEKMVRLMDAVVERENMWRAYSRVMRNKGAAGVDDMPVADLKAHLQEHWPQIKEDLLAGRLRPLIEITLASSSAGAQKRDSPRARTSLGTVPVFAWFS